MKLNQLVMFTSVAKHGSLREASDLLHKTQPAISQAIRQLESELGFSLFSRSGYRLALTSAGKTVYQHALRLLDEASSLRQVASHIAAGNESSITLSFEASFDLRRVLPLLESVQGEYPNTQIVLKQEFISGAVDAIQEQSATLSVSPMGVALKTGSQLVYKALATGALLNVCSPVLLARHPQLKSSKELINEYQIVVQDSGSATKDLDWGVQDGQRRWYVNDFATKTMLIERGMGWGKLPDYHAQPGLKTGKLVALDLNDMQSELKLDYYVIKHRQQVFGPVAQALWDRFLSLSLDSA